MGTTTLRSAVAFPRSAIEAVLRDEFMEAILAEATLTGISLPQVPAERARAAVPLDSLVAVAILCSIEPIVGFELPESTVRTGGYSSVEDALGHLLPKIEKLWIEKRLGNHERHSADTR